jgi:hypothetical protein
MPILPTEIITVLITFAPLFSRPVFQHALVLLIGAILTPGRRTVANILRVMGVQHSRQFQNYHCVFNRAHWSSRKAAQLLLELRVRCFAADWPTRACLQTITRA